MWTMGGGDVDDQDEWRRRMRPDNQLPGSVALDLVLAETADAGPGCGRPSSDDVQLMVGGGGGGLRSADVRMFLSPLPPPGPITIVCAWPKRDVPESSTTIDSAALRAAATRARELWPWEPFTEQDAPEPPPAPPGGWFEETRRQEGE